MGGQCVSHNWIELGGKTCCEFCLQPKIREHWQRPHPLDTPTHKRDAAPKSEVERLQEEIERLRRRIKQLEKENLYYSWQTNPDRMGS